MPILPLNDLEPFAAVLGVMLFPGETPAEQNLRRAFVARHLAKPIETYEASGGRIDEADFRRLYADASAVDGLDLDDRFLRGSAVGEMVKLLRALSKHHPELASWENAAELCRRVSGLARLPRARSWLMDAKRCFSSVGHLWGAWSIRQHQFIEDRDVGYDYSMDFEFFLAESEVLRRWGTTWRRPSSRSKPFLPEVGWRVPGGWAPPDRRPDWPRSGGIPDIRVPPELLEDLRPPGRPKRSG